MQAAGLPRVCSTFPCATVRTACTRAHTTRTHTGPAQACSYTALHSKIDLHATYGTLLHLIWVTWSRDNQLTTWCSMAKSKSKGTDGRKGPSSSSNPGSSTQSTKTDHQPYCFPDCRPHCIEALRCKPLSTPLLRRPRSSWHPQGAQAEGQGHHQEVADVQVWRQGY